MVGTQDLNLARKWRPKHFDAIVGQDVSVRMLKNSLYLNKFFPVYLFAGQRGCGKTSSARVFAAAVNCQQLATFQSDPSKQMLPCLECLSCQAMVKGNHPDFIEVDAASNTGVDNVRQIIDTSNYMPLLGQKKVYLIDEAHMLSKAAFNAFLKLLEEPPATVIFILATTEVQKIPQTVLSRCFQVLFSPIGHAALKLHLEMLCQTEQVTIESEALDAIIQETEGSARDAINLLERVRFSGDIVTQQSVFNVLGKMTYAEVIDIFRYCIEGQVVSVIEKLNGLGFEQRSPQMVWDMMVHLCRCLAWVKYGVKALPNVFEKHRQELEVLARQCSINRLNAMLQLLWEQEELFLKTNKKHLFLEMVLLQLCQQVNLVDLQQLLKMSAGEQPIKEAKSVLPDLKQVAKPLQVEPQKSASVEPVAEKIEKEPVSDQERAMLACWKNFVDRVSAESSDQFLMSIFAQARPQKYNEDQGTLVLALANNTAFLRDKIEECSATWGAIVHELFPGCSGFSYVQSDQAPQGQVTPRTLVAPVSLAPAPQQGAATTGFKRPASSTSHSQGAVKVEYINSVDRKHWPLASLLMAHFPGKLKKTTES
ncbi:MAG: DNA polymerase III subunit gamma/tau [Candidatus Babeliales bacterium]